MPKHTLILRSSLNTTQQTKTVLGISFTYFSHRKVSLVDISSAVKPIYI